MARRQVIEVACSRCERKELRDADSLLNLASPTSEPPKALVVRLGDGTKIDFDDLCEPCMGAVKGHLEAIGKKIVGLSPERKKKDEPPVTLPEKKK
jgi:hypothetical protein